MKGSVKIKFDFGWTLSVLLAMILVIGGIARAGFTMSVQKQAAEVCAIQTKIATKNTNMSESFIQAIETACIEVEVRNNMEVFMDISAWTYSSIYPKHYLPYNYKQILAY